MIWAVIGAILLCIMFRAFITIMQRRNNRSIEHNTVTGTGDDCL